MPKKLPLSPDRLAEIANQSLNNTKKQLTKYQS